MVRDPGNRFTENVSFIAFVETARDPAVSDWKTSHETPKTIQATMEPSGDLRGFLATLCPQNLRHLEKSLCNSSTVRLQQVSHAPAPLSSCSTEIELVTID